MSWHKPQEEIPAAGSGLHQELLIQDYLLSKLNVKRKKEKEE